MTGDVGGELGAIVKGSKEIEGHPIAANGTRWTCSQS
jgi:hypothetical protein